MVYFKVLLLCEERNTFQYYINFAQVVVCFRAQIGKKRARVSFSLNLQVSEGQLLFEIFENELTTVCFCELLDCCTVTYANEYN